MSDQSNGFLANVIETAAKDTRHPSHGEASSYLAKFRSLEDTLFKNVHPFVDMGLAIREVQAAGRGVPHIFTIHGPRHIKDLIRSLDSLAAAIADEPHGSLSPLEAYILLCAAHVHDTANVNERRGHPEHCREVIEEYKALFSSTVVMQHVYAVASVHGGEHTIYGKDTLRSLDVDNLQVPRLPMLAAMLRIGDELSENAERVPDLVARHHEHSPHSKLAFAYARSFLRFDLRKDNLYLTYGVHPEAATLEVVIDGDRVGFFGFLETKLDVIDQEARYCSQYGWPGFHIGRVSVTVHLYAGTVPSPVVHTLKFDWPLYVGYPRGPEPLCSRSPELMNKGVQTLAECFPQPEVSASWISRLLRRWVG